MRPTGVTLIAVYDYLAGAFLGLVGRPVRWRQSHQHAGRYQRGSTPAHGIPDWSDRGTIFLAFAFLHVLAG
jgi:hypothetical protein